MEQRSLIDFFMETARNTLFVDPRWDISLVSNSGIVVVPVPCELVEAVFNFKEAVSTGGANQDFVIETNRLNDTGSIISVPDGTVGGWVGYPSPRLYLPAGTSIKLNGGGESATVGSFTRLTFIFRKT